MLAAQAPCDLGHEVCRQPQVIESLLEGFGGVLRLAAVSRETLLGFEVATLSGLRVFFYVSFGWGHGELLCTVWLLDGRCERNHAPSG